MSIATYEEVLNLPNHPEKVLIDVRRAEELHAIGRIPTSIHIPFQILEETLNLPSDQFKTKFGRAKPRYDQEVIFYCNYGARAQMSADLATHFGYTNARYYKGSYYEWAGMQGLPIQWGL